MATELTILAAFALTIVGQLIWLAWQRQQVGVHHPGWTPDDRKQVRTFRTLILAGVVAAWIILLLNFAHDPNLVHETRLLPVASMPLLLSSLALTLAYIAPRGDRNFRPLMVTAAAICAAMVGTSLPLLALTWAAQP